jgi:hypothetical protein
VRLLAYVTGLINLPDGDIPKSGIWQTLVGASADVSHVVAEFAETVHRHPGDVLINENLHPLRTDSIKLA